MNQPTLQPWQPTAGQWNRAAAAHLCRRAGFGAPRVRVSEFLELGVAGSIDRILAEVAHSPRLLGGIEQLLPVGQLAHLQAWWCSLILAGSAPLTERMTLMWHDHFATSNDKVADVRLMHRQNKLLRETGLGDFRKLLLAMATDPAMLIWLDGNDNRAGQANENFAREVMELFALGVGNYSERDIQEAARAFTGWGTQRRAFHFYPGRFDGGTKTIFGQRGKFGGEEAIALILGQAACPVHIARRLLQEFVHPTPQPEWITATAEELLRNDWHLAKTVETLLRSQLFFSPSARRSRIAAPIELLAGTAITLGAHVPPLQLAEAASDARQSLFRPPSVKGWDGQAAWIDAGTWITRHNVFVRLARSHLGGEADIAVDLHAACGRPDRRSEVPRALLKTLLPDLEDRHYTQQLELAASEAANVDEALATVTALILTSPEYHLI